MRTGSAYFHEFIKQQAGEGRLVVQPRMGFSDIARMRTGLEAVKRSGTPAVGTITLDSFTRTGDFLSARKAIEQGLALNGYPIVTYTTEENRELLAGLREPGFPVQVRHGSPLPEEIFKATIAAGIDAIEGGPVSYCFPYGRIPLAKSIAAWRNCCRLFAAAGGDHYHIESFGGCMMGQLCPPAILIAITIVEVLFMKENGLKSYSVSLAQGTNSVQDVAALQALRLLCEKYLGHSADWHIVFYNFMGKFPQSFHGSKALIEESARIAVAGQAERLIVKTVKEAHQIPLVEDNINALRWTHETARQVADTSALRQQALPLTQAIREEADFLIDMLLNLGSNIEEGIDLAFRKGYWDVPYCLHPDNKRASVAQIDGSGYIFWSDPGKIPFPGHIRRNSVRMRMRLSSGELLHMLSFNQQKYDEAKSIAHHHTF